MRYIPKVPVLRPCDLIESKVRSGGKNPNAPAVKPNFAVHGQRPYSENSFRDNIKRGGYNSGDPTAISPATENIGGSTPLRASAHNPHKGFQNPFKGPLPDVKVPGLHEQLRPAAEPVPGKARTPSIGRIVHFVLPAGGCFQNAGEHRAAIIVRVWGNDCVNLKVFTDSDVPNAGGRMVADGVDVWVSSVIFDPTGVAERSWHWPEDSET